MSTTGQAIAAAIALIIVALFLSHLSVSYDRYDSIPTQPVCHAPTEDSDILDCDYHDGGWYQK